MSRVKQIHEEKKSYNLLIDYKKKQKLSELRDKHSPEFSNWRGTVTEGMNTGNVFFTTLPSTGEVDLETIPTQTSGSFEGVGSNSALENTVVKGSGSGSSKPTPKEVKYDPKKPGGGQEYQQAARNWQRQNPGKYNPYRSDAQNKLMKDTGVGTKPNPNSNFRNPVFNSYEPQGDSLMDNYEPKAKHNDKVAKVTGRLKTVSDFLNHRDVKPVFPKDPPPEMVNGRHPDLVDGEKISNRFNKLDPTSAKSMPKTGNPKIDAKVSKALKKPK